MKRYRAERTSEVRVVIRAMADGINAEEKPSAKALRDRGPRAALVNKENLLNGGEKGTRRVSGRKKKGKPRLHHRKLVKPTTNREQEIEVGNFSGEK